MTAQPQSLGRRSISLLRHSRRLAFLLSRTYKKSRELSGWTFPETVQPPTDDQVAAYGLPLLQRVSMHAAQDPNKTILRGWKYSDGSCDVVTYKQALDRALLVSDKLMSNAAGVDIGSGGGFIANLCVPGWEYVASLWGTWASGNASVPLALSQKVPELEHVLSDTDPTAILLGGGSSTGGNNPTHRPPNESELVTAADNLGMKGRIVRLEDLDWTREAPSSSITTSTTRLDDPALVMYTSGTTGKPKGVLSTHRNVFHQVTDLVSSWEWASDDIVLHVLPLHHVHGVINLLCCGAYAGAQLHFRPFEAKSVWEEWATQDDDNRPNVFMAVPTIYAKLLESSESLPNSIVQTAVETTLKPMRLMVSGSSALPVSVLERWRNLTGHTLLERYGMTEFAMAFSNPYEPESQRHPGHVGLPLPSVTVKIITDESHRDSSSSSGFLFVKGSTVFQQYLNRPDATAEAFDEDGFFDTGDIAEYNEELKSYRILGRASVDIVKVGGYKLSALEIERVLLEHPDIAEIAVVGVDDDTWGQRVGAICRLRNGGARLSLDDLRGWCQDRMAKYRVPSRLLIVDSIPKNAMGKVNKKDLVQLFETRGR